MISSDRPSSERGRTRLIRARNRRIAGAGAVGGAPRANRVGVAVTITGPATASIRLQHVAAPAHRLQIARKARVGLDLAPQPGHLHVDGAAGAGLSGPPPPP